MAGDDKDQNLSDRIHELLGQITNAPVVRVSKFDKTDRDFIPHGVIDRLIDEQFIKEFGTKPMIDFNSGKAKTCFAIAVNIGIPAEALRDGMRLLEIAGISDETLPVDDEKQMQIDIDGAIDTLLKCRNIEHSKSAGRAGRALQVGSLLSCRNFRHSKSAGIAGTSPTKDRKFLSQIWTYKTKKFCQQQWSFLAEVFCRSTFTHDLNEQSVLPFVDKGPSRDTGSVGLVSKYRIHHSHLIDSKDSVSAFCPIIFGEFHRGIDVFSQGPLFHEDTDVAVKEIQPNTTEERKRVINTWEQEARVLQQMNLLNQPHIVQLHTAFRRGAPPAQDHYLMLEWANGGNLKNLWNTFDRPALTGELVKATVHQLLGLAQAMEKAHYPPTGPNFRHGDLKPENILWFKDESGNGIGTLKIGDWGIAKEQFRVTEMRSKGTTTKWGTRRYEPPEESCSQGTPTEISGQFGKKRSRLYDVWALGCITLEFVIWLMYGRDELDRFNKGISMGNTDSNGFYLVKPDENNKRNPIATVHYVATTWMEHMAKDPVCAPGSTALGSLLEVVQTQLLVIDLPKSMAKPSEHLENPTPENDAMDNIDSSTFDSQEAGSGVNSPITTLMVSKVESSGASTSQDFESSLVPRMPGWRDRKRARASDLHDRLLEIERDHDEESYWFAGQPKPPKGPEVNEVIHNISLLPPYRLSAGETAQVSLAFSTLVQLALPIMHY